MEPHALWTFYLRAARYGDEIWMKRSEMNGTDGKIPAGRVVMYGTGHEMYP